MAAKKRRTKTSDHGFHVATPTGGGFVQGTDHLSPERSISPKQEITLKMTVDEARHLAVTLKLITTQDETDLPPQPTPEESEAELFDVENIHVRLVAATQRAAKAASDPEREFIRGFDEIHENLVSLRLYGSEESFVIIEAAGRNKFVQFGRGPVLMMDVPFAELTADEKVRARSFFTALGEPSAGAKDIPVFEHDFGDGALAAAEATVSLFQTVFQLPADVELTVTRGEA
jgi:hypothetical protein